MPELSVRPVTEVDVADFGTWRYPPPYDVYDIDQPIAASIEYFLRPTTGCHVLVRDAALIAFFTLGHDAQVPGGDYSVAALDIGMGLRPSLTGLGQGSSVVAAVVEFASVLDDHLRVTIATENQRARRVWANAGFVQTADFRSPAIVMGTDSFVVLERT